MIVLVLIEHYQQLNKELIISQQQHLRDNLQIENQKKVHKSRLIKILKNLN